LRRVPTDSSSEQQSSWQDSHGSAVLMPIFACNTFGIRPLTLCKAMSGDSVKRSFPELQ
jgi:hypothetical protein